MKVSFISLGCAKNLVNTEQMMALCRDAGHTLQEEPAGADVVVINTCGFIDSAKSEAIDTILAAAELKAAGEVGKILVTGCLSQRYQADILEELPEIDGIQLLRRMKADPALRDIPVIMATAKGAEYDKIRGLDLGADYYLTKPFGVMELVSCVKAVLRRCGKAQGTLAAFDVVLDPAARRVTRSGTPLHLTPREFDLLEVLLRNRGILLSEETKNPNPSPIEKRFGFSLFGAMEGTRTPGLLIRRNRMAHFVHFII